MKKVLCLIIIFILMIFNGCIEKKVQVNNPQDNYIIFNIGEYPKDLIMADKDLARRDDLLNLMFEGLVRQDSDGSIVPAIADSWEISNEGTTYTFHIRDNARWNDGSEINAEDFVLFFSEILSKSIENDFAHQLDSIYGVNNYRTKGINFKEVAIRAPEKKLLEIRLNGVNPDLLKILSQPVFSLRGSINALRDWKKQYTNIKFSGPYYIREFKGNDKLALLQNGYYWDKDSLEQNSIMITVNPSSESSLADFETFKIDIMKEPPLSEVKRLVEDKDTLVVYTNDIIGLAFNFEGKTILRDADFRRALYEVLDPVEIAENSLAEFNIIINSYAFSGTKNVFKENAYKGNREKQTGKQYIKKFTEKELPSIKLVGLNTDKNKKLGKAISDTVKENLNINIQWKLYDEAELSEIISKKDFDLILTEYEQPFKSELLWLEKWRVNSKENYGKYSSVDYNNVLDKIKFEGDAAKRKSYIEECSKLLKEDMPVIPLFYDVDIILKNEYIQDLRVNPNGTLDFRNAYKYINWLNQ